MTTPGYRMQNGEDWGDEPEPVAKDFHAAPLPRRANIGDRARLARARRKVDPTWNSRSRESRRLLLDLDWKEETR